MKKKKFQLKLTRRQLIKAGMIGGAGMMLPWKFKIPKVYAEVLPGGTLVPDDVIKYSMELVKPPAMPGKFRSDRREFQIAVKQFSQQILGYKNTGGGPRKMLPQTTVWSYGPANLEPTLANSYFYPAFTVENQANLPTRVKWVNGLVDGMNRFLPHLLPVDPSLHWANPIGRRDTRPNPTDDPNYWDHPYIKNGNYVGPVPMVVHVHGAHVGEASDGYTEAWYLPNASNYGNRINYKWGRFFDYFRDKYKKKKEWGAGSAWYEYTNDQSACTLWYHDHSLGMTRLNVYAGPAGFWLIRGGTDDRNLGYVAPVVGSGPFDSNITEIPIAIQDRSFNSDGSLFYPDHRAFFEGLDPSDFDSNFPFTYNYGTGGWGYGCGDVVSDVAPIWQPEFFGNMMVVNGRTWPYLPVKRQRYRFRLLNGCNSRFLILMFDNPDVKVWQIGAEQGFLPEPVLLNDNPYPGYSAGGRAMILMAPAERADIIVDFSTARGNFRLLNVGPDEPFGGGTIGGDFDPADTSSTGQVMQFRPYGDVVPSIDDPGTHPDDMDLPDNPPLSPVNNSRNVSLNEEESQVVFARFDGTEEEWITPVDSYCRPLPADAVPFGPTAALLGSTARPNSKKLWKDPITEIPRLNATEEWSIYNNTVDAHPIHVHLVKFQVVYREEIGGGSGTRERPKPWERGNKDTVIAYPGQITRIRMNFDLEGFYVWHCHIVEHEDNEMMRPFHVGPIPGDAPAQ